MDWTSVVPEGRRNEAGEWLCLMCDEPGAFCAEVACEGCGASDWQRALATRAQDAFEAAEKDGAAALARVREALAAKTPPDPVDQRRVTDAHHEGRAARAARDRAVIYAVAYTEPHSHPVYACAEHKGA